LSGQTGGAINQDAAACLSLLFTIILIQFFIATLFLFFLFLFLLLILPNN